MKISLTSLAENVGDGGHFVSLVLGDQSGTDMHSKNHAISTMPRD